MTNRIEWTTEDAEPVRIRHYLIHRTERENGSCGVNRTATTEDLIAALKAAPGEVRERIGVEVYHLPKAISDVRTRQLEDEVIEARRQRDAAISRAEKAERERDEAVGRLSELSFRLTLAQGQTDTARSDLAAERTRREKAEEKGDEYMRALQEVCNILPGVVGKRLAPAAVTAAKDEHARCEKAESALRDAVRDRDRLERELASERDCRLKNEQELHRADAMIGELRAQRQSADGIPWYDVATLAHRIPGSEWTCPALRAVHGPDARVRRCEIEWRITYRNYSGPYSPTYAEARDGWYRCGAELVRETSAPRDLPLGPEHTWDENAAVTCAGARTYVKDGQLVIHAVAMDPCATSATTAVAVLARAGLLPATGVPRERVRCMLVKAASQGWDNFARLLKDGVPQEPDSTISDRILADLDRETETKEK